MTDCDTVAKLRSKLETLSNTLNRDTKPTEKFRHNINHLPTTTTHKPPTAETHAGTKSSLLAQLRDAETRWAAERGCLQLQIRREQRRAHQAEENLRRVESQRDFHLDASKHLKQALKERDGHIIGLEDQIRDLEIISVTKQELEDVQSERDELKAKVDHLHNQLTQSTEILSKIETESTSFRRQLHTLTDAHEDAHNTITALQNECSSLKEALEQSEKERETMQQIAGASVMHFEHRRSALTKLLAVGESLSNSHHRPRAADVDSASDEDIWE